jgi:hypothetical protein
MWQQPLFGRGVFGGIDIKPKSEIASIAGVSYAILVRPGEPVKQSLTNDIQTSL